jgi:general nucleoside transport system ATP-binding protein
MDRGAVHASAQQVASTSPHRDLLLETRGLTKAFGALRANDGVDLQVRAGEIHAILGENGAGKSTLMKMLYGYYQPTSGEIRVRGQPVRLTSPHAGRAQGIGMVFQAFTLIPAMEVWENVALFLDGRAGGREALLARIREVSRSYGLDLDPTAIVRDLPLGTRQKVEIVKILLAGARIVIFDEPTSVLAPHEAEALFAIFDRLRGEGYAVLFITHKMNEVLRCADRITVLRKGRVAASLPAAGATKELLVALLVGEAGAAAGEAVPRRAGANGAATAHPAKAPVLRFEGVSCLTDDGRTGLSGVAFDVMPGEVLGVAAVSGNGQEYFADLILGLRPASGGQVLVQGRPLQPATPRAALASGVACLPEDPLRMGAVGKLSVRENLILGSHHPYWSAGGWVPDEPALERAASAALMTAFVQSPPRLHALAGDLSGGNLHRVLIARELGRRPALFVSYYLTRGLDLSNARAARELVLAHAARGMALLFISEDLDELFALSDRILVLHAGRAEGIFRPAETTPRDVGLLMTGAARASA